MEFKTRIGKIKNNSLQNLYYDITTFSSVNNDNYKVNNKKHRNIAIILVKNADGIITFNNSKINIGPKQLIYIPANIEHNIKVTSRVNSYTELLLSNNFSMPLPNRPVGITSSAKDYNFIYHLLSNLKDRTTSEYYRFNITRLLLSWIIEHSPTNSNNGLLSPKLENIIKYLRDNKFVYATLDEAAEISNMSKTNFSRLFKENFNISYHQFILEIKISDAKSLLNEGVINCHDISKFLGFCNPSHFTKVFKKRTGYLPKDYIKLPKSIRVEG